MDMTSNYTNWPLDKDQTLACVAAFLKVEGFESEISPLVLEKLRSKAFSVGHGIA